MVIRVEWTPNCVWNIIDEQSHWDDDRRKMDDIVKFFYSKSIDSNLLKKCDSHDILEEARKRDWELYNGPLGKIAVSVVSCIIDHTWTQR